MSEKCNRELRNFYFSGLLKWQTWETVENPGRPDVHIRSLRVSGATEGSVEYVFRRR